MAVKTEKDCCGYMHILPTHRSDFISVNICLFYCADVRRVLRSSFHSGCIADCCRMPVRLSVCSSYSGTQVQTARLQELSKSIKIFSSIRVTV